MYRVYLRKIKSKYGSEPTTEFRELLYGNDVNGFNPATSGVGEGFGSKIINPVLTLEESVAGSFSFDIPPSNRLYSSITIFDTLIEIERDNIPFWAGRVISTESKFNKVMSVTVEGLFACLNDTMQPYMIYDDYPTNIFRMIITNHLNTCSQRKQSYKAIKSVTISRSSKYGPNRQGIAPANDAVKIHFESEINDTMSVIQDFISTYGGYLKIEYDFDTWTVRPGDILVPCVKLTWCEDLYDISGKILNPNYKYDYPDWMSHQVVQYASNLIDLNMALSGDSIYTVLIPRGNEVKRDILPESLGFHNLSIKSDTDIEVIDASSEYTKSVTDPNTGETVQQKFKHGYAVSSETFIPYEGEGDNLTIDVTVDSGSIESHYKDMGWLDTNDNINIMYATVKVVFYCHYINSDPYVGYRPIGVAIDLITIDPYNNSSSYRRSLNSNLDSFKITINNILSNYWLREKYAVNPKTDLLYFKVSVTPYAHKIIDYNDYEVQLSYLYMPDPSNVSINVYNDNSKVTLFSQIDKTYYPLDADGHKIKDGDNTADVITYVKDGNKLIDTSNTTGIGKYGWIEKVVDWDIDLVPSGQNYALTHEYLWNMATYQMQYGRYSDLSIEIKAFDLSLYNNRPIVEPAKRPPQVYTTKNGALYLTKGTKVYVTEQVDED